MNFDNLFEKIMKHKNEKEAEKMSAYMLNKFKYIGIKTPERRKIFKNFFKEYKKGEIINWEFINKCWENEYRELQYSAIDYLKEMVKFLTEKDIPKIKKLIVTKSWWDTVDGIDVIVGKTALKYPKINKTLIKWSKDKNIWLRRIAIDHQLLRKGKTNTELLSEIIENNLNDTEFFINKAIGWALRDYSKTNPDWVRNFIEKNKDKMSKLSIKEASKYI